MAAMSTKAKAGIPKPGITGKGGSSSRKTQRPAGTQLARFPEQVERGKDRVGARLCRPQDLDFIL
jgi:hypothetical protein